LRQRSYFSLGPVVHLAARVVVDVGNVFVAEQ
jgi:hypothetical protein